MKFMSTILVAAFVIISGEAIHIRHDQDYYATGLIRDPFYTTNQPGFINPTYINDPWYQQFMSQNHP